MSFVKLGWLRSARELLTWHGSPRKTSPLRLSTLESAHMAQEAVKMLKEVKDRGGGEGRLREASLQGLDHLCSRGLQKELSAAEAQRSRWM